MDSELTFRVVFATLYILAALMRVYYAVRGHYAREAQPSGEKPSTWECLKEAVELEGKLGYALYLIFSLFWVTASILYVLYPEWMTWFAVPLPIWLRWTGVGLEILSLSLLVWVHHTIGRYWTTTLELREQHKLVTSGPYRWVRHPMYTMHFVFFVALSLVSANWLVVLPIVALTTIVYARISKEETMMIEQFGDEYRDYMKRTGRLLPRLIHEED